ncbi:cache domain-containing protein [Bradyrhizobium sp. TZ2]
MRATVIAELGNRFSSSSGRRNEAVWLFTALVLTAAIPVLLLGGWMAYITADQERSYARTAATEALTQVAHRIEGEISREMQVAETLASSAALDQGNLSAFYREATRIVAARPLWETAALTKPDQEQVLNVLRPLGAPLGPVTDTESFNAVLRTRKPVLGGLGPYQAAIGKQLVSLRVPVIRDGELRYILTIGLLPDQIGTILGQAGLPAGWAGTVIDAREKSSRARRTRVPPVRQRQHLPCRKPLRVAVRVRVRREPRPVRAWMLKPSTASWPAPKDGRSTWASPCRS